MVQGLKPGHTLLNGTYRIEKVLGQGSFGITYLAKAKFTTRGRLGAMDVEAQVAIKEFFMSDVNSRHSDGSSIDGSSGSVFTNYRKKFKKEAENLSKLSHPNIVRVFDVFDENNTTYYVMEFLEGTNLDDYIKQHGHLQEREAISITKEIGEALAYMHSQNMLHLDIKPRNIMRTADGQDFLIDFGLSKQFTEDGEPESSTSIGLGTPGYSPLEQAGYKQDGTFPATLDVYALGATMFKMLTGKRPPEATNVLNEGFPDDELAAPGVSEQTATAVEKAMAPVKKKRYQTVRAFLNDLDTGVQEEATVVSAPAAPHLSATPVEPVQEPKVAEPVKVESTPRPAASVASAVNDIEEQPEKSSSKKWIWFPLGFLVAITFIYFAFMRNPAAEPTEEYPESVVAMEWNSPLGEAIYTGDVVPVTIPGKTNLVPHGKGMAKITKGEYEGCTYEGDFEWGKMNGQAVYTQNNGDTFEGEFKLNQYSEGKYTVKASGEYFQGTFKDGAPDKGAWYDKNGKKL